MYYIVYVLSLCLETISCFWWHRIWCETCDYIFIHFYYYKTNIYNVSFYAQTTIFKLGLHHIPSYTHTYILSSYIELIFIRPSSYVLQFYLRFLLALFYSRSLYQPSLSSSLVVLCIFLSHFCYLLCNLSVCLSITLACSFNSLLPFNFSHICYAADGAT